MTLLENLIVLSLYAIITLLPILAFAALLKYLI